MSVSRSNELVCEARTCRLIVHGKMNDVSCVYSSMYIICHTCTQEVLCGRCSWLLRWLPQRHVYGMHHEH